MLEKLRLGQAPGEPTFLEPAIGAFLARDVLEELLIDALEAVEHDGAEKIAFRQILERRRVERLIEELEFLFVERRKLLGQDVLRRGDADPLTDHRTGRRPGPCLEKFEAVDDQMRPRLPDGNDLHQLSPMLIRL